MSLLIVRLGDEGSHGDVMITASDHLFAEGIAVCRVGDIYNCPIHGPNPIVDGSPHDWQGPNIAYDQCPTACGAVISASCAHSWTHGP